MFPEYRDFRLLKIFLLRLGVKLPVNLLCKKKLTVEVVIPVLGKNLEESRHFRKLHGGGEGGRGNEGAKAFII